MGDKEAADSLIYDLFPDADNDDGEAEAENVIEIIEPARQSVDVAGQEDDNVSRGAGATSNIFTAPSRD